MEDEKLLTSVHSVVGALTGYLSNLTGKPVHAFGVAVALLFVTANMAKYLLDEDKGAKWWIGNAVAPFMFIWLVFAVFFYNL